MYTINSNYSTKNLLHQLGYFTFIKLSSHNENINYKISQYTYIRQLYHRKFNEYCIEQNCLLLYLIILHPAHFRMGTSAAEIRNSCSVHDSHNIKNVTKTKHKQLHVKFNA